MLAADHINSDGYYTQWQEYTVCTDVLCWVCGRKQETQQLHYIYISRKDLSTE
jgi:hypothetical protein